MKTTWILKVAKGYREVTFKFDDIKDAEAFMMTWINHKDDNDGYEEGKPDRFIITPVIDGKEQGDVEN